MPTSTGFTMPYSVDLATYDCIRMYKMCVHYSNNTTISICKLICVISITLCDFSTIFVVCPIVPWIDACMLRFILLKYMKS